MVHKYCSYRSSSSKSLKLSTKERAIQRKVQLADLEAEATFLQKRRYPELQAKPLRIQEEMEKHKSELRSVRDIDQKVPLKT